MVHPTPLPERPRGRLHLRDKNSQPEVPTQPDCGSAICRPPESPSWVPRPISASPLAQTPYPVARPWTVSSGGSSPAQPSPMGPSPHCTPLPGAPPPGFPRASLSPAMPSPEGNPPPSSEAPLKWNHGREDPSPAPPGTSRTSTPERQSSSRAMLQTALGLGLQGQLGRGQQAARGRAHRTQLAHPRKWGAQSGRGRGRALLCAGSPPAKAPTVRVAAARLVSVPPTLGLRPCRQQVLLAVHEEDGGGGGQDHQEGAGGAGGSAGRGQGPNAWATGTGRAEGPRGIWSSGHAWR